MKQYVDVEQAINELNGFAVEKIKQFDDTNQRMLYKLVTQMTKTFHQQLSEYVKENGPYSEQKAPTLLK